MRDGQLSRSTARISTGCGLKRRHGRCPSANLHPPRHRGRAQRSTPGTLQNIRSRISPPLGQRDLFDYWHSGSVGQAVSLSQVHITAAGGGLARRFEIPEETTKYPEADMFGELPA